MFDEEDDLDDLEPVDERGRTPADHSREKQTTRRKQAKTSAWRLADQASIPERLAVGLSIHPKDPELAAKAAGLILDPAELKVMTRKARKDHSDIIAKDPNAYARVAFEVKMLAAIHLRDSIGLVPPGSIAATIRQLAQVQSENDKTGNLAGSVGGSSGAVIIQIGEPYDPPNDMPGPEGIEPDPEKGIE